MKKINFHNKLIEDKKSYTVTIEEHISGEFIVHADNLNEALRVAELNYRRGAFVIEPTVPTCRQMMAQEESTNKETEWVKF